MTTGSSVLNGTYDMTFTPPTGGTVVTKVGVYKSRTHSGQDRTPAQKAARVPSRINKVYRLVGASPPRFGGFQPPMKRGDVPHPYTVSWMDYEKGQYRAIRNDKDTYKWFYVLWMVGDCDNFRGYQATTYGMASIDPKHEYELLAKIRDKVFGSGFHPGITLGEGPKAIAMIGDAARKLRYGFLFAAIGDMRGVFHSFGEPKQRGRKLQDSFISYNEGRKTLSSLWLELQYGWLPLLGDIESGARYIGSVVGGAYPVSQGVSASRSWESVDNAPPSGWFDMSTQTVRNQLRYKILNMKVAPVSGLPSVAAVAGVAWELLPYSFVADWAMPISAYLDACRTASNITGTVVRSHKQTMVFSGPRMGKGFYDTRGGYLAGPLDTHIRKGWFTRTVASEITPPSPLGDLSPSSIMSSWTRATNAVALLQNLRIPEGDKLGFKRLVSKLS